MLTSHNALSWPNLYINPNWVAHNTAGYFGVHEVSIDLKALAVNFISNGLERDSGVGLEDFGLV